MAETAQAASKRSTVTVSGYESGSLPPDMLSDLICKIPDLLCYLSEAASLQSILATSSALQQQVHQHVTKVTVGQRQPQQDLAVLVKGHWPLLVHVCSCWNAPKCWVKIPQAASWMAQPSQLHNQLQSIDFSYSQMTSRSVAVLLTASFRQLLSLRLMSCKLETQCAQALSASQLSSLQALDLTDNRLGANAVAHICIGSWPHLRQLRLAQNPVCRGVCHLATANWPLLEKLHLEMACLEDDALAYLCQGKWPCLQTLGLSHNNLFDCPNIQVEAAWSSLKEVRLAFCAMPDFTLLHLQQLLLHDIEVIDLLGSCVDAMSVQLLVQADWPKLTALRLNGHGIDEAGVPELIKGNWPRLERLYLSYIDLCPEVVQVLSKGCWPSLRKLDVCNGNYKLRGVKGLQPLVHAQWPSLEWLCLFNVFQDHLPGVFEVLKSQWPSMTLHLHGSMHDFPIAC